MKAESPQLRPEDLLEHVDWLRQLARALVRSSADADDLAQETARVALDTPPATDRPLRPWLAGVLRNLARMTARSRHRAQRRHELAGSQEAPREHAADLLDRVQAHHTLSELVIALDEPFRTTVLLRYCEGLSAAEIARELDIPAGTVRWRLKRALDTLRDALDQRHGGNRARWSVMLAPLANAPSPAGGGIWQGVIAVKTSYKIAAAIACLLALFLTYRLVGPLLWDRSGPEAPAADKAPDRPAGPEDGPARAGLAMRAVVGPGGLSFTATAADPRGTLRLEGQVVDEHDDPVTGARVAIDSSPPAIVTTEADGSFAFDGLLARRYTLEARAGQRFAGPVSADVHAAVEPVILRASMGAELKVKVVAAEDDRAIAGAEVELRSTLTWSGRTGADGVAVLSGVGPSWRTLIVRADGYAPSTQLVTEPAGGRAQRVVRLERGAPVSGKVVSASGEPVAGALVWATNVSEPFPVIDPRLDAAVSDAQGRWALSALPAGSFRFTAAHDDHAQTTTPPRAIEPDEAAGEIVIRLDAGGAVTGRVVDRDGQPVTGATVRATAVGDIEWSLVREAVSGDGGAFRIAGLPRRRYQLIARHGDRTSALVPADLGKAAQVEVALALEREGAIAGLVVDSGGDPIADAQVFTEPVWGGGRGERSAWRATAAPIVAADREGRFRIGGLGAGRYRVRATRNGADPGLFDILPGVEASPGDHDVRVVVPAEAVITGKVAFADGEAPRGFTVAIGDGVSMPFSGDGGRFSLGGVAGKHNLVVSGPGLLTKIVPDVQVKDADTTDVGTVTVERGRSVSGRVIDADGEPVAGATVAAGTLLTGDGEKLNIPTEGFDVQETETDAAGRFVLSGFDERSIALIAGHDQRGRSDSVRVPGGSASATVELVLQVTGSLAGKVTMGGRPLPDTVVIVSPVGGAAQNFFVITGPDGSFALAKLTPARYTVTAMLGQGGGEPKDMHARTGDVAAGKRATIDIDIDTAPGSIPLDVAVHTDAGQPVALAQVALGTGTFAADQTTFGAMRQRGVDQDEYSMYVRMQIGGAPARIEGLPPGEYSACARPIPAAPGDQNAMRRLMSQGDKLPVRCVALGAIAADRKPEPIVITVPAAWAEPH